jgi:hypothetical protein
MQERNVDRSLWHLARKWGIEVQEIPLPLAASSQDEEVPAGQSSVHLLLMRPEAKGGG